MHLGRAGGRRYREYALYSARNGGNQHLFCSRPVTEKASALRVVATISFVIMPPAEEAEAEVTTDAWLSPFYGRPTRTEIRSFRRCKNVSGVGRAAGGSPSPA